MNGLPYYKRYPRDIIDGTVGMTLELKGAYSLVLDLIYLQNGELPDDARYISGAIGCSVRQWNAIRAKLLAMGKIEVRGAYLGNYRADKELVSSHSYQDKQRENRAKASKNKRLAITVVEPKVDQSETEAEREDTQPNGCDGDAVISEDFAKQVFDRAVAYLGRHGTQERQARTFVGKLRKDHSDSEIFEAFMAASKEGAVDPIPWIVARLVPPKYEITFDLSKFEDANDPH